MKHILIIVYTITLVLGTWSILYSRQTDRIYRTRFLKPLANYVLLWCLWIFLYQVLEYIYENLLGQDFTALPQTILIPAIMAGFLVQAGILYTLAVLAAALTDRSISHRGTRVYALFVVAELVIINLGFQGNEAGTTNIWMTISALVFNYGLLALTILVLGDLLLRGRKLKAADQRRIVPSLTFLLATCYLLYYGAGAVPVSISLPLMSAGLFLFCAVPMIWIRWIFLPNAPGPVRMEGEPAVQQLFEEFGISKREQEIIGLILEGLSNKEMEDVLSISYHTVKNHIYNIFQKLGVKSRGQLIHRILQAQNGTIPVR
ncbi:response regulator transcription factor [Gemmatimonadota bacterium]